MSCYTSSGSDTVPLSIRKSCDRCRCLKLKCSVERSTDSSQTSVNCQRCLRAMVPCVFSRRHRSRNTNNNNNNNNSATALGDDDKDGSACPQTDANYIEQSPDQDVRVADSSSQAESTLDNISADVDWHLQPVQDDLMLQDMTQPEAEMETGDESLLNFMFPEMSDVANVQLSPSDGHSVHQSSSSWTFPNRDMMDMPTSLNHDTFNTDTVAMRLHRNTTNVYDITRSLLDFTHNLHVRLEELENRTYPNTDARHALHNYPIGGVLYLTQSFSTLVSSYKSVCFKHNSVSPPSEGQEPDCTPTSSSHSNHMSAPSVICDTSIQLLLLNCFFTMIRIHLIVLGHFKTHMQEQTLTGETSWSRNVHLEPSLCLGQLLPSNTIHSQIYTAVQVLLESRKILYESLHSFHPVPKDTRSRSTTCSSSHEAVMESQGTASQEPSISTSIDLGSMKLEVLTTEIKQLLRDTIDLK